MQHPLLTMFTIDYCKNVKMKETTKMTNLNPNMYIIVGYMINKVFKFLPNIFLSFYILHQVQLQVFFKMKSGTYEVGMGTCTIFLQGLKQLGILHFLVLHVYPWVDTWQRFGRIFGNCSTLVKNQCWVVLSFQPSLDLGFKIKLDGFTWIEIG